MSSDAVGSFFENAYSDRKLQGALHMALAASSPDVVVEIAKTQGHEFSAEDLQSALEDEDSEVEGFAWGRYTAPTLSRYSLSTNFWSRLSYGGGGLVSSGFQLTIPGPSFVQVMGSEADARDDDDTDRPSAVDLYENL